MENLSKRQIVIDAINHKKTQILPYNVFYTIPCSIRLAKEFKFNRDPLKQQTFIKTKYDGWIMLLRGKNVRPLKS